VGTVAVGVLGDYMVKHGPKVLDAFTGEVAKFYKNFNAKSEVDDDRFRKATENLTRLAEKGDDELKGSIREFISLVRQQIEGERKAMKNTVDELNRQVHDLTMAAVAENSAKN
jgi:polyhydroxyalkanoate synthesis regulator phasin